MAYAIVTAFVLLGAINSQNNLLFWALGLAIGGLLASGFVSGMSLMGIALEREPVPEATSHRPFVLRYRVRNRSRFMPAYALLIEELPPKGTSRDDWALVGRPMASLGRLSPRRTVRCETSGLVEQRGPFELGRVRVSTTFPFGVARKSVTFDLLQPALATPRVHRLRSDVVETILEPTHDGTEAIASPGAGEEFYGVREYRTGDRVRDVSWRLSARSDTLVVTQRSARSPRRLVLHLELDPAVAAEHDARVEQLLSLAASRIAEAGRRAIAVSLAAPESGITTGSMTTPVGRAGLLRTLGAYGFAESTTPQGRPPAARFGAVVLTLTGRANAAGVRTFTGEDLARLRAEPERAGAGMEG
ncbi:MAG: DUF58 domain-containing protein [Phycisphaerales bacterium]